ncbi:hypothetical protein RDWZM_000966 [Blomia tropicalis]|uniref:Jumonji domain-containing protein 4 n=1 Tax=Blomia tropicalis TaxID=40697 RepID=A0A9Q0MAT2_BLOTA|nr:hypothetical protein RDWZM_000966 [Blomia tropicalis]
MKFSSYINYWKKFSNNEVKEILYLKDWHFFQDTGDDFVYEVPEYFESDYLNEYCLSNRVTDYRFVYLGPQSSSTPVHIDVFGSYSWSANICGRKKWLFIPSCNVMKLKQLLNYKIPNDLYTIDNREEIFQKVEAFEVIQNSGEILFVPSGFMHQVINLVDTLSINHNWFNGCNLDAILDNILDASKQVQNEINDLRNLMSKEDWLSQCQQLLSMHFGLNMKDFIQIISFVADRLSKEYEKPKYSFRFEGDVKSLINIIKRICQLENPIKEQFNNLCLEKINYIMKQLEHFNFQFPSMS